MKSNIRKLRNEKNISQTELAKVIGKTQQTVSHMERDRDRIQIESLLIMADYFGVTTDCILGRADEEESPPAGKENISIQGNLTEETEALKSAVSTGDMTFLYNLILSLLLCSLGEKMQPNSI